MAAPGRIADGETGGPDVASAPRPHALLLANQGPVVAGRDLAGEQAGALHASPPGARA